MIGNQINCLVSCRVSVGESNYLNATMQKHIRNFSRPFLKFTSGSIYFKARLRVNFIIFVVNIEFAFLIIENTTNYHHKKFTLKLSLKRKLRVVQKNLC